MARIRSIKPDFPQSESMGQVSREARLCFIMLWTIADDQGRLRGNSRMLASLLFPYDDDAKDHMDGWLDQLSSKGCIARYEVDGTRYIQVLNWIKHQKIDKPTESKLPPFNESLRVFARIREDSAKAREGSAMDKDKDKDKEGNGKDKEGNSCGEPQSDSPHDRISNSESPHILTLPLVDGSEHPIAQASVDEWCKAFPAVDVMQQLHAMRAWCVANKANRKTARGIGAFVVRWLSKAQDKAPRVATPHGSPRPVQRVRMGDPGYEEQAAEDLRKARELLGFAPIPPPSVDIVDAIPKSFIEISVKQ
ncbi:MAG: hypothetical protein LBH31_00605 [Burkholderiaceae bacterium]|jgi:hypothetical protein|nr:hypothetical protein [Burkholderiaceae bacterium]